jgi:hypothetical protein
MKQSSALLQPKTAPTKRLYLRKSPRRRNNHSLERGFYIAEFSTGDDPVNFIDLWGLEDIYRYSLTRTGSSKSWTVNNRGGVTESIKTTTHQTDYYSSDKDAISDLHSGQKNGTYSVGQVGTQPSTQISDMYVMDRKDVQPEINERLGQGKVVEVSFVDKSFESISTLTRDEDGTWSRCSD